MGEAKRRSQSDPQYGRVFQLHSAAAKTQHSQLVMDELFTTFAPQLKTLIRAPAVPDDYQLTCDRISHWLARRLLRYREGDRQYIAQFILSLIAQLEDYSVVDQYQREDQVSPVLLCCIFQATKSYFSDEAVIDLELSLKTAFEQLSHQPETRLLGQSLLRQI